MLAVQVKRLPQVHWPATASVNMAWQAAGGGMVAAMVWLSRVRCGVTGHEMVRHFERGRMSLECLRCGEETAGWALD